MKSTTTLPDLSVLESKVFLIRRQKVMLSHDLAEIYEVETKILNKAVKRNPERFPEDFMFQLTEKEVLSLRFQFGTSSWGGGRYRPFAFTEQGIAMLSGVLKSEKAVQANIAIMRAFVSMREQAKNNRLFAEALKKLERKITGHDEDIKTIFAVLRQMTAPESKKKNPIGFAKS